MDEAKTGNLVISSRFLKSKSIYTGGGGNTNTHVQQKLYGCLLTQTEHLINIDSKQIPKNQKNNHLNDTYECNRKSLKRKSN